MHHIRRRTRNCPTYSAATCNVSDHAAQRADGRNDFDLIINVLLQMAFLDVDSLEHVLNMVSTSGLLRATHTARLVDRSWNHAVNSRAHRLREVSNNGPLVDISALLSKTPHLTALDMSFSRMPPAACRQLHRLHSLQELCLADCSDLAPKDMCCLHRLTSLQVLKLCNARTTGSAALANCSSLLRLHTLELRDFKALDEKIFTGLARLTSLNNLSLVAEEGSNTTLGTLSMQLLSWCAPHLTYLQCGKIESTYPLEALRELSQLQVLSLTNCKPFLKPDSTGHDLLVQIAHLTHLSSLELHQFSTQTSHSGQILQDLRQLKGLRCLHVQHGHARGFIEGLTALTGLVELILLDDLTEVESRYILNEVLLSLFHLTRLELSVTGDVLVEGFRLFRNLPFLKNLKFAGSHCLDTKGVSQLFWGLTSLTGSVTSLSLRDSNFGNAVQGRYRTAAGAGVPDLDLGEFPVHSLQVFANVFPEVQHLRVTLTSLQELPLQPWLALASLYIDWQPESFDALSESPLALCESLAQLPSLRCVTIGCPSVDGSHTKPFELMASKHADLLQALPGVDVFIVQSGHDTLVLSS